MLEILYNKTTKVVSAWATTESQFGQYQPASNETTIILPVSPPALESDWYKVDLRNKQLTGNPDYKPLIKRDLLKEFDELKAKNNLI